ncbi:MAG TPA: ATP-binding protein, partial [Nitrososphaera sp.]|nr:ATP-binding protein [Nitrososphaera sp.]
MIRGAKSEVFLIFPTINAIHREHQIGVIDELRHAVKRGVKIRVLAAEDEFIKDMLDTIRASGVIIRRIETPTETKFKLLIIDRKMSLVVETRDDSKKNFAEAIGLAIFSDSTSTVAPYVSIFETLWRETDLYEKTREAERVKDEFVNIAAHELRNPITPILHGAESLQEAIDRARQNGSMQDADYDEIHSYVRLIVRNVTRLMKLSEDILQVSRIESGTFALNVQPTRLKDIITGVISDVERKYNEKMRSVKIVFEPNRDYPAAFRSAGADPSLIVCDGSKIEQCIFNLLDNAVKFTKSGTVNIIESSTFDEASVLIRDSGEGIDPQISGRLFGKFVTKSEGGTGLGLYVSKKIVEAHGGRIWAAANQDGKGMTFGFSIPRNLNEDNRLVPIGASGVSYLPREESEEEPAAAIERQSNNAKD